MTKEPKRKILVIDDDLMMIRILERILMRNGCEIVRATTGEIGIDQAKTADPDCILLDIMLPDINGQDVARRLQQDPETKQIPIIFLTVTLGVETDKGNETLELDGKSYRIFAKPLHEAKLWSVIRKSINAYRNS